MLYTSIIQQRHTYINDGLLNYFYVPKSASGRERIQVAGSLVQETQVVVQALGSFHFV